MHGLPLWVLHHQKSAPNFHPLDYCKSLFRHSPVAAFTNFSLNHSIPPTPAGPDRSPQFEYSPIEDVERMGKYRPGGYHPITIGDELHARYRVLYKLGHGTYSTTWLARDECSRKFVAVKVGTAESNPREANILSALATTPNPKSIGSPGRAMIPLVLDGFNILGRNGIYPCYVTAPARASLSDVQEASSNGMFQLDVARSLVAQLTLAVVFTHSQGFVHGGEFPMLWS